ncbi:MAG: tetratricopeptide repeat protein [Vampirovibrionales bacterium]
MISTGLQWSIGIGLVVLASVGFWWWLRRTLNAEYYYNKAIDLYEKGKTQRAIIQLEKAFKLDPSYQPIIYNLGVIHLALKNNHLAKDYFYLALQSNPEDTYALYNLGVLEYEDQNYQFAIDHWLKCLEYSDEIDSDTYYCLGLAYEGLEQHSAALSVFEKTLEIDPTHVECMVAAGRLFVQFNNLGKGLELYDLALTYDSEQAEAHLGLALVNARLQQWEDVTKGLTTLEELMPDNPSFLNLAGLVAFKEERWSDAVTFFEQALEQTEDYLAALNNLGYAYEKQGKLKRAIKCFQAVLSHPEFPSSDRKQMQAIVRKLRRPTEELKLVDEHDEDAHEQENLTEGGLAETTVEPLEVQAPLETESTGEEEATVATESQESHEPPAEVSTVAQGEEEEEAILEPSVIEAVEAPHTLELESLATTPATESLVALETPASLEALPLDAEGTSAEETTETASTLVGVLASSEAVVETEPSQALASTEVINGQETSTEASVVMDAKPAKPTKPKLSKKGRSPSQ